MVQSKRTSTPLSPEFLSHYKPKAIRSLPKYAVLRETLLAAIEDGYWPIGERVPNEAEIADSTPYSLGTVQKAMQELVQIGVLRRVRGSGSFVARRHAKMYAPLHFKFEDNDGTPLPVYPRIIGRRICKDITKINSFLRVDSGNLLCIERIIDIGAQFLIFSRMYLDAKRFPIFTYRETTKIEAYNFKILIRREYNVEIARIKQALKIVTLESLSKRIRDALCVSQSSSACKMELKAIGRDDKGIYYQEVYIPQSPYTLRLSDWIPGA